MTILPIIKYPDNILRKICKPVKIIKNEIQILIQNMFDTMNNASGIGLAASQIGDLRQIIVLDCIYEKEKKIKNPMFFINPKIIWKSKKIIKSKEGCLSIPGIYENIVRSIECTIQFLDYKNNTHKLHCINLLSICIQHEIDHLNGILIIDHISRLKRDRAIKKYKKQKIKNKLFSVRLGKKCE